MENLKKQLLMCLAVDSGVKIKGNTHGEVADLSCVTDTSVNIKGRGFTYGMWADLFDIKPILFDLSNLTKEITIKGVNDGKPFVPIEEMKFEFVWNDLYDFFLESYNLHEIESWRHAPHELTMWLAKLNFNLYLKKGEYIPATNEYAS